jgi:hypothetical protein
VYLHLTDVTGTTHRVEIPEGRSAQNELRDFMAGAGRFTSGWAPLGKEDPGQSFIRIDRVAEVRVAS